MGVLYQSRGSIPWRSDPRRNKQVLNDLLLSYTEAEPIILQPDLATTWWAHVPHSARMLTSNALHAHLLLCWLYRPNFLPLTGECVHPQVTLTVQSHDEGVHPQVTLIVQSHDEGGHPSAGAREERRGAAGSRGF